MDNKVQSIFASVLAIGVGAWMMLVPAFTSVTDEALISMLITGGVIAFAGIVQMFWENVLPSWVNGLAAVWLFISAFVFDVSTAVSWNLVLGALGTIVLALWDGVEIVQLHHAHHTS